MNKPGRPRGAKESKVSRFNRLMEKAELCRDASIGASDEAMKKIHLGNALILEGRALMLTLEEAGKPDGVYAIE